MKNLDFRFKKYQKCNTGLKRPVSTKKTLFMGKSLLAIGLPVLSFGVANAQCLGSVSYGATQTLYSTGVSSGIYFDADGVAGDDFVIFAYGNALKIKGLGGFTIYASAGTVSASALIFAANATITGPNVNADPYLAFADGNAGAILNGATKHIGFKTPTNEKGFITITANHTDPGSNAGRYQVAIAERGTDIDGHPTKAGDCSSLPVEFVSFMAKAGQESIQLAWLTASEENNAGFEVQRSTDGRNFRTLTFIEGHGTTLEAQKYLFDDKELRKGQLYYYRLKQIDFDGRFEHSDVVSAQLEEDSKISVLAPNPTHTGQTHLEYTSDTNGELTLQVFDVTGKELFQHVHRVSEGTNRFELDLSTLGKGLYFVKLNQGNWSGYEKVVVE